MRTTTLLQIGLLAVGLGVLVAASIHGTPLSATAAVDHRLARMKMIPAWYSGP
jgi:hypothetical protein